MFGLEALLGKAGVIGAAVLGVLAILFATFLKGKSSARKEAELDTLRATRDAQVKVGEAVGKDAAVDAEARAKVEAAKQAKTQGKQGDEYKL